MNKTFSENLSEDFKKENYYLPLWEDNVSWKKQHDGLPSKYSKSFNPYERWPTPESFRNYCYDEAEKDKEVKDCNTSWGWCEHCVRSKNWD
ncbi:hypothetical protein A6V39_05385 [Candidatus Mycoplasma haematobovis]|uniref:Uncharacterized protein n=1 Tax=Candidatus Mycoplasma haematobovis TaxID=432608 RepID=A0A1A9QBZ5_9MOLU|nr:hypothetical protein [Candidatus Mycoplasma haematobovis]OAL09768.1 hypothetical protein A6V39_05385 [Candidatus Mycoplasma haematobovis]